MRIEDRGFLRTFARRFCGRSSLLDGASLDIIETATGVELHIGNGFNTVIAIGWQENEAFIIAPDTRPGFLSPHFDGLEDAMTDFVAKCLRRHRFIDRSGQSTRKGVA